jgi:ABC-type branched-subunit amino acid transport system substrate-binding protein
VSRFAILYPDDEQGRLFRDLFQRALTGTRGRVVASVGYGPEETDFRHAIAQLKAAGSFDALFIPDNHRRVALLAPQLIYYDVKDVMLLGINRWNNDELARTAGAYLSRAVFVDGFFARAANPEVGPFVDAFRGQFGQDPSFLAAVGFDTARMMLAILARAGAQSRDDVRNELLHVQGFVGVTGELSMGEDRNLRRRLYLLRVGPSAIEELY